MAATGATAVRVLGAAATAVDRTGARGTLAAAVLHAVEREPIGEYVVVLEGAELPPGATDEDIHSALIERLEQGATRKSAVASVAQRLAVQKNRVYDIALGIPAQPRGSSAS